VVTHLAVAEAPNFRYLAISPVTQVFKHLVLDLLVLTRHGDAYRLNCGKPLVLAVERLLRISPDLFWLKTALVCRDGL
jgi:hypothetical protein